MVVRAHSLDRFAVVVAAILLLSVVQGVDAPLGGATVPGEDGRIVYVSEVDGDMEIYSVNPDGSDPVNLTNAHTTASGPIDDHDPAWSPDGRRIAFTRSVMDPDVDEPEIVSSLWVMDTDGSNQDARGRTRGQSHMVPGRDPDCVRRQPTQPRRRRRPRYRGCRPRHRTPWAS